MHLVNNTLVEQMFIPRAHLSLFPLEQKPLICITYRKLNDNIALNLQRTEPAICHIHCRLI